MSRIRADKIVDRSATGGPLFPNGAVVTGVITATTFDGNSTTATTSTTATNAQGLTGTPNIVVGTVQGTTGTFTSGTFSGNVSIGGTLTYEDVSNVDSVGIITARNGIDVTSGVSAFGGGLIEKYEKAGTTLGSQTNNPITDGNVILFSGNESGNNTINFTGVHSRLSDGETCSFTAIISPNNSGVINVVQVDGQAITINWEADTQPTAGSSGYDIYTFQIFKTGTGASDYTVFGAAANYG